MKCLNCFTLFLTVLYIIISVNVCVCYYIDDNFASDCGSCTWNLKLNLPKRNIVNKQLEGLISNDILNYSVPEYRTKLLCYENGGVCHKVLGSYKCDLWHKAALFNNTIIADRELFLRKDAQLLNATRSGRDLTLRKRLKLLLDKKFHKHNNIDQALKCLKCIILSPSLMESDSTLLLSKLLVEIITATANLKQKGYKNCDYVEEIISSLVVCCDIIFKNTEKMTSYVEARKDVIQGTRYLSSFLEDSTNLLTSCLMPGAREAIILTSKTFLWAKVDHPLKFLNLSKVLYKQESFFKISPALAKHILKESPIITIEFMSTENNLFWWEKTTNNVNQLTSLSIKNQDGEIIRNLKVPIDLYFKYDKVTRENNIISGFVIASANLDSTKDKDTLVSVHRLEPLQLPGPGKVLIQFYNIGSHRFKILLLENERPDYETMMVQSTEISNSSSVYELNLKDQTKNSVNYFGVLLYFDEYSIVQNIEDRNIRYDFKVHYIQCHSRSTSEWTSDGCFVGPETSDELLHCQCWHLSFFGGSGAITPRMLDLEKDIELLVVVKDNPKTFMVVTSIILLYFMVLVWTRHNDGKDRLQRYVLVLEDNFPGEEWPYLITVYTGFWIGSGTDANLGFRMFGSKGISRIHNLQSRKRKVLKGNCDDWFLIFTPKSLGNIEKIHIFHDHTGESPDWYCSKVMVYDLQGQKDFKFVVEKWMSLTEEDEFVEHFVHPTSTLKSLTRDRIAIDNVIFALRETHLLISIFTRHPRSSVTRSQRLSVCFCILIVHMLTNIMFYGLSENEYPAYSEIKRRIIITMESSMLASPFTFIIIFCFKKSRIVSAPKSDVPMTLTSTQAVPLESGLSVNQSETLNYTSEKTEKLSIGVSEKESDSGSSATFTSSSESDEEEEVLEEEEQEIEEGCWKNCCQQIKALLFQAVISKAVMPVKIAEEDEESSQVRKQWMYFACVVKFGRYITSGPTTGSITYTPKLEFAVNFEKAYTIKQLKRFGYRLTRILCETAIFASALLVVLYSLKMDSNVVNKWMRSTVYYSFSNIFLMAPIKIILFSTILALLYGQLQYIPSYECNTETAMKQKWYGNEWFLQNVLATRKHKWYHPLKHKHIMEITLQEKNWRRWRIIISFTVVILLYAVLTTVLLTAWDGFYVETKHHLENMFDHRPFEKKEHKITQFQYYITFLTKFMIPELGKRKWYNKQNIMSNEVWTQEMGFVSDYCHRIVGYPRIRQQRVTEDSCEIDYRMKNKFSQCNAPLTWWNMDDKVYYTRWTQPEKNSPNKQSPWSFSKSNSPLFLYSTATGKFYLNGGYIARLSYNQINASNTIQNLYREEWFDSLTRVVFFEMLLLNVNSNLLSYVSSTLEKLADGSFNLSVQSATLHPRSSSVISTFLIMLAFTFYYCLRMVLLFNRKGVTYLLSFAGLLDIFLNVLLYMMMISLTLYRDARKDYLDQWQLREQEDLQINPNILFQKASLMYEMAVLVLITPAQVMHNFRFGRKNMHMYRTLSHCFNYVFGLALVIIIYYVSFYLLGNINNYHTVSCPFSRCFSQVSYASPQLLSETSHLKAFTVLFCFVTNLLTFLATAAVILGYREAKFRFKYCSDFNIFTFLLNKFIITKNKLIKIKGQLSGHTGVRRFRAGADHDLDEEEQISAPVKSCEQTKFMCDELNLKINAIVKKLKTLERNV